MNRGWVEKWVIEFRRVRDLSNIPDPYISIFNNTHYSDPVLIIYTKLQQIYLFEKPIRVVKGARASCVDVVYYSFLLLMVLACSFITTWCGGKRCIWWLILVTPNAWFLSFAIKVYKRVNLIQYNKYCQTLIIKNWKLKEKKFLQALNGCLKFWNF